MKMGTVEPEQSKWSTKETRLGEKMTDEMSSFAEKQEVFRNETRKNKMILQGKVRKLN